MDAPPRFRIIFEKLEEAAADAKDSSASLMIEEVEAIAELRRMVLELTDAPVATYTTT